MKRFYVYNVYNACQYVLLEHTEYSNDFGRVIWPCAIYSSAKHVDLLSFFGKQLVVVWELRETVLLNFLKSYKQQKSISILASEIFSRNVPHLNSDSLWVFGQFKSGNLLFLGFIGCKGQTWLTYFWRNWVYLLWWVNLTWPKNLGYLSCHQTMLTFKKINRKELIFSHLL